MTGREVFSFFFFFFMMGDEKELNPISQVIVLILANKYVFFKDKLNISRKGRLRSKTLV